MLIAPSETGGKKAEPTLPTPEELNITLNSFEVFADSDN